MFEQDYIMRLLLQMAAAIRRSLEQSQKDKDPATAAETLENTISEASDVDGSVLLSLAPESIAGVMQISGTDPQVAEYISRSLLLESQYLSEAGREQKAQLRKEQAFAIAHAFGFAVEIDMLTEEEWESFFLETGAIGDSAERDT